MKKMFFVLLLMAVVSCENIKIETFTFRGKGEKENTDSLDGLTKKTGIVLLADGTYSGTQFYVVPPLTINFVSILIDKMRSSGGGTIWVSYIDDRSQDNECISFDVPPPLSVPYDPPTVLKTGYIKFRMEKQKWQQNYDRLKQDSINELLEFNKARLEFIKRLDTILTTKVYVRNSRNLRSDVNGSVMSAQNILRQALQFGHIHNAYIIGFSDFEDNVRTSEFTPENAIKIFNLISQPGRSNKSITSSIELVSENDVLKSIKF